MIPIRYVKYPNNDPQVDGAFWGRGFIHKQIEIKESLPKWRKRRVLYHELGHWLLDKSPWFREELHLIFDLVSVLLFKSKKKLHWRYYIQDYKR